MADMGLWLKGLAGVTAALAVFYNLPTSVWLPAEKATLQYLAAGTLLETVDAHQGPVWSVCLAPDKVWGCSLVLCDHVTNINMCNHNASLCEPNKSARNSAPAPAKIIAIR